MRGGNLIKILSNSTYMWITYTMFVILLHFLLFKKCSHFFPSLFFFLFYKCYIFLVSCLWHHSHSWFFHASICWYMLIILYIKKKYLKLWKTFQLFEMWREKEKKTHKLLVLNFFGENFVWKIQLEYFAVNIIYGLW